MDLVWKDVVGYEGHYQVSNYGDVKSLERLTERNGSPALVKAIVLSKTFDGNYYKVALRLNGKTKNHRIHKLVMEAFGPPCPGVYGNRRGNYQIDHCDDDKLNNRSDNLQWLLHADNCFWKHEETHPFRTQTPHRGVKHGRAKLTETQARAIRNDNRSQRAIAKEYGVDQTLICLIKRRKCWAHIN